jgi:hypothetical protein
MGPKQPVTTIAGLQSLNVVAVPRTDAGAVMLLRAVAAILFPTCAVQITTTLPVRTGFYSQTTDLTRITFEVSMHICIFVVLSFQVRVHGTGLSLQGFMGKGQT